MLKLTAFLIVFFLSVYATAHNESARTPITTGNGYGFAVINVAGKDSAPGTVEKVYAHPYRFMRPNKDLSKEGAKTPNLVRRMSWTGSGARARNIHYLNQSHIITADTAAGQTALFMPWGLHANALVAIGPADASGSCLRISWNGKVASHTSVQMDGAKVHRIRFSGLKESVLMVPLVDGARVSASCYHGQAWALVITRNEHTKAMTTQIRSWQKDATPDELVKRELGELESWRVPAPRHLSEAERRVWRQNEVILRMAQIREPNLPNRYSHGLILASLPDGVWFIPWVRDMAYAVVGLVRMGHHAEARLALEAWFNVRKVGLWKSETRGFDYQISTVRYYGDGTEEADYSGESTPNIEFDNWGLALWTLGEYIEKTGDLSLLRQKFHRGTLYEMTRELIVKPLIGNLDPVSAGGLVVAMDSSPWEEHQQNKRHYVFPTVVAIRGLKSFVKIAKELGEIDQIEALTQTITRLEAGLWQGFHRQGRWWGTIEPSPKNETDGAFLEALTMGVVRGADQAAAFSRQMEVLRTSSGGFRRVTGQTDYEAHEFLFVDFSFARMALMYGDRAMYDSILDKVTVKAAADNGLIPEMYVSFVNDTYPGEVGAPAAATPMVGYGAGAYIITILERPR